MTVGGRHSGALVFGAVDGLTLILGLILGLALAREPYSAVWHTALASAVAELGGMSLGQYWSDQARHKAEPGSPPASKVSAACNGLGAMTVILLSGAPFAIYSGTTAILLASVIIACFGLAITIMREETGWLAVLHTFGLLLLVGALAAASGLM